MLAITPITEPAVVPASLSYANGMDAKTILCEVDPDRVCREVGAFMNALFEPSDLLEARTLPAGRQDCSPPITGQSTSPTGSGST